MMIKKTLILLGIMMSGILLSAGVASCGEGTGSGTQDANSTPTVTQTAKADAKKTQAKKKTVPSRVTIYRYEKFPESTAIALRNELSKTFQDVVLAEQSIPLPAEAYHKERKRYQGKGLLNDLGKRKHGDAVLGLTDHIIYHPNEISPTYGVMGLSTIGTYTCVVSSQIPKNGKTHKPENFVKLSLHELGHAFGLPHCPDQHCYMVDAEHKMKLPQTNGFL